MFEDSTFASTARRNPRRGWAAAVSFAFQAVVLGIFVLVPLLYTDALPLSALKGVFVVTAPTHTSEPPKAPEVHRTNRSASNMENGQVVTPIVIPPHAAHIIEDPEGSPSSATGPYIPGSIPDSTNNRQIAVLLNSAAQPIQPTVAPPSRGPYRISHMDEGLLLHRVTPQYPTIARQARVQGPVVLHATIGRDGRIENLQVLSGHPMLVGAAIEAVKQWRYRPYILNNEPVEVETQITVNFTLGG